MTSSASLRLIGGTLQPNRFGQETSEAMDWARDRVNSGHITGACLLIFDKNVGRHSVVVGSAAADRSMLIHALSEALHVAMHEAEQEAAESMRAFDKLHRISAYELRRLTGGGRLTPRHDHL